MSISWTVLGASAALVSNAAWIVGSALFSRVLKGASPFGINLGRGLLTLLYLGLALLVVGWRSISWSSFTTLGLSGLLGMALGDTLFFAALMRLGARLTILIGMLGPVFSLALGVGILHEAISATGCWGIGLVLTGLLALLRPNPKEWPRGQGLGVLYAVLASLSMACANLLSKQAMLSVPPLQAAFVRMLWSVLALALVGVCGGRVGAWLRPFRQPKILAQIQAAVVVVVFGGFFLSMVALACLPLSTVSMLMATEPLMALGVTALMLGQPVTRSEFLCVLLGLAGVLLLFQS